MRHRRSKLLINRRFQLRYCFYVCSWLFALSMIYPWLIYTVFDFLLNYLSKDPMGPDLANLREKRQEIIEWLVFLQVVFMGLTGVVSLFLSHRIAGPLYKLRQFMAKVRNGEL